MRERGATGKHSPSGAGQTFHASPHPSLQTPFSADPGLYASISICRTSCCFQLTTNMNYTMWLLGRRAAVESASLCRRPAGSKLTAGGAPPWVIVGKAIDDIAHGERHATCLLKAQKEVLICIGKLVLKRLELINQVGSGACHWRCARRGLSTTSCPLCFAGACPCLRRALLAARMTSRR